MSRTGYLIVGVDNSKYRLMFVVYCLLKVYITHNVNILVFHVYERDDGLRDVLV